jgi:hypothetical protein
MANLTSMLYLAGRLNDRSLEGNGSLIFTSALTCFFLEMCSDLTGVFLPFIWFAIFFSLLREPARTAFRITSGEL